MDDHRFLMGLEQDIKAIDKDFDSLRERLAIAESALLRLTTASPTPTAPMTAALSDVAAESTPPTTPPSSQSARPVTESGPAVLCSGCAHDWQNLYSVSQMTAYTMEHCRMCGVYRWCGKILVPAARQVWSISVKPDLKQSAAPSYGAFAASPSND